MGEHCSGSERAMCERGINFVRIRRHSPFAICKNKPRRISLARRRSLARSRRRCSHPKQSGFAPLKIPSARVAFVVCCQSRGRILPSTKTHHLLSRWINANCYGLFQDSVVGESCIMICFNIHMKKSLKDDLKGISSRLDLSHLLFIIVANHELT